MNAVAGLFLVLLLVRYSDASNATDASGNCTFDEGSFCGWTNEAGDHFDWTINNGSTPSGNTGPSQDHLGTGHYVYIETSRRLYDMRARLLSPMIRGPKSMRFYYHMHGATVDTLNIYKTGIEKVLWSRFGSHGNEWIEGCVPILDNGTFQVVIEGVRGLAWTGDIAVDDISFTDNLYPCNQSGMISPHGINSANCSFDAGSLCGWRNSANDDSDFKLNANDTPVNYNGPSKDHTGDGRYIYTSGKAAMESSWLRGTQCMWFYYKMYGVNSGTIDVYQRTIDNKLRLTRSITESKEEVWDEAMVKFSYFGEFKVIIQAMPDSLSYVAIDNVTFTPCLLSSPTVANCNFKGHNFCQWSPLDPSVKEYKWAVSTDTCDFEHDDFCGWKNVNNDDFDWEIFNEATQSNDTGPSKAYEGIYFIYIEATKKPPGYKAKLLSRRMVGPHCMTFYYHMYGEHMGSIEIYLHRDDEEDSKLWEMKGDQGNKWKKVTLQVNYEHAHVKTLRPFRLLIIGTVGSFFKSDAAIDNISVLNGLCDAEHSNSSDADIGAYIFTQSSRREDFGTNTRLVTPLVNGSTCLTFYYRLLGTSESCIVVSAGESLDSTKTLWLRSGNIKQWTPVHINIQETGAYIVMIEGLTSTGVYDEAAIANITFTNDSCPLEPENTTFCVAAAKGGRYEIARHPSSHSSYLEKFQFTAQHPKNDADENGYFVYPTVEPGQVYFSREFLPKIRKVFPLEYINSTTSEKEQIYLISREGERQAISTNKNMSDFHCCKNTNVSTFPVSSVEKTALSKNPGCTPGWYRNEDFCYLFNLKSSLSWHQARTACHKQAAELVVPVKQSVLETLSKITTDLGRGNALLYLGLKGKATQWMWPNGSRVLNNLWAPNAPNGRGKCGSLSKTGEERTWYWKDQRCDQKFGYICEQQSGCTSVFFHVGSTCLHVNSTAEVTWSDASKLCNAIGGELATVDPQILKSNTLQQNLPVGGGLHIGLSTYEQWQWLDGTSVNSSFWHPGYPQNITKWPTCAALSIQTSKLLNFPCKSKLNFVCSSRHINVAYGQPTSHSSEFKQQKSLLALDDSYSTCFRSMQEPNPWWKVQLQKSMYIYQIKAMHTNNCCSNKSLKIEILDNSTVSPIPCQESAKFGETAEFEVRCEPPVVGDHVRISVASHNASLLLCNVAVYAIDSSFQEAYGVLRESWYDVNYNPFRALTMKDNPEFMKSPQSRIIVDTFETATDLEERSIQRQSAYIHVKKSAEYNLLLPCGDFCELWIKELREEGFNYDEQVSDSTGNSSKVKFLSRCQLYRLESYATEEMKSAALKISGPGNAEGLSDDLYWISPGKRTLEVTLNEAQKTAEVGSEVPISGVFRYCCHGLYCPNCSIQLNLSIANTARETTLLTQNVDMSCVNTSFLNSFTANLQPGSYNIKIRYSFKGESRQNQYARDIGKLELKAALIYECRFKSSSQQCSWQTKGQHSEFQHANEEGSSATVDDAKAAVLVSPTLQWKPFHKVVGVCLRFLYLMKDRHSNLKVFLRFHNTTEKLLWNLSGYHGNHLNSTAQVYWPGEQNVEIVFERSGAASDISVEIDNVKITTENCRMEPYFAKPGFKCSESQFQCHNGECIKGSKKCDGDSNCGDKSDENDCKCPTNKFSCSSEKCISTDELWDGNQDCEDGSDERNIREECKGEFQSLSGKCEPRYKVCQNDGSCLDEVQYGAGYCLQACDKQAKKALRCRLFGGVCGFEDSLCGLNHDKTANFTWSWDSGATPTDNTGPGYDHTTFTSKGSYIFIEASQRRHGDKARLLSGNMQPNETICVQFWYHVYGRHTGTLRVLLLTNQSRTVVWERTRDHKNHENRWKFAQTLLQSSKPYKFALEAETVAGKEGDIALDDLSIIDGTCQEMKDQESGDCNFDQDMCGWVVHGKWKFGKEAFRHSLTLSGTIHSSNITSPVIFREWTCLKFWYYASYHDKQRHPKLSVTELQANREKLLFKMEEEETGWNFVQIPIVASTNQSRQIRFSGSNPNLDGHVLAIDNVTFMKEHCERIPWKGTDPQPCSTKDNMCRWKILRGDDEWKRENYNKVQEIIKGINQGNPGSHYEMQLPNSNIEKLAIGHFEALARNISICFWVHKKLGEFFLEYKDAKQSPVFGLHANRFLFFSIQNENLNTSFVISDGIWHHVCLILSAKSESSTAVKIYTDGDDWDNNGAEMHKSYITADGEMTIGFRVANSNNARILGSLSSFNVWNYHVTREQILLMLSGCGQEAGNAMAWSALIKKDTTVRVVNTTTASCKDRKAVRLLLSSKTSATAFLLSPQYDRSKRWYTHCLKFRYMLYGPGARKITVYQEFNKSETEKRPVWTVQEKTSESSWNYGQVPLSASSGYKIIIEGQVTGRPGYVSISGAYVDESKDAGCTHQPSDAKRACSVNITSTSGTFASPFFPSYYLDNMECVWNITVPHSGPVRLNFLEFRLEDHPTCDSDFVEIFDGPTKSSRRIGKFCGYTYPPLIQSSSNSMLVVFKSNNRFTATGFKAQHRSLPKEQIQDHCLQNQKHALSCKCTVVVHKSGRLAGPHHYQSATTLPRGLPSSAVAVFLADNRIAQLRDGNVSNFPLLEYLDLSRNRIVYVERNSFSNVSSLKTLRFNSNFIRSLPVGVFGQLKNLQALDLGMNFLTSLDEGLLEGLLRLNVLSLRGNLVDSLDRDAFVKTRNLTHLYLQNNKISNLPDGFFSSLHKLRELDLSNNRISELNGKTFLGLKSLTHLNLEGNRITKISLDTFSGLTNLKYLKVDHFTFCCYAKASIPSLTCDSPKDEFSSCDDLMKNKTLRVCIWVLGCVAFLGNLTVIIWRKMDKEQSALQSMMIINLAFADLFMGVYLLIIASADAQWAGEYFKHDIEWRSGIGCKFAGILSMLSSEVSVMMLSIITAVRYARVVYTFKMKRMNRKQVTVLCIMAWILGLLISVIPIFDISYFTDEETGFGFYSRSAVCLPLHLSNEKPVGWEYSVAFFIGLNFASFMFIIAAYCRIYCQMKHASKAAHCKSKKREQALARRLLLIITSDFCCWMPIIIIGILSLVGQFPDPEKQAYVWIAVFILPLNSSLNPILYTFSASTVKDTISGKSERSRQRSTTAAQQMRIAAIKNSKSMQLEMSSTVYTDNGAVDTRL